MDQSGSGIAYPEIINRRRIKSHGRLILESLITLAFWSGFIYLLIPLLTLVLWLAGVQIAYTELIGARGLTEFLKILRNSGLVVLCITLIILGWSYYNYLWFRIRGERRNSRVAICYDEDFCKLYHLDLETLRQAKEEARLEVLLRDEVMEVKKPASATVELEHPPPQAVSQGG